MSIIKAVSLMIFAFGVAISTKYIGFNSWVEANSWIGLPMTVVGAFAVCMLFGRRD